MVYQSRKIEPLRMNQEGIEKALELQRMRREAGLTHGQLAHLLGIDRVQYMDFERAEEQPSPAIMAQIRDILEKVKAGTLEVPNLNREG